MKKNRAKDLTKTLKVGSWMDATGHYQGVAADEEGPTFKMLGVDLQHMDSGPDEATLSASLDDLLVLLQGALG